MKLSRDAVHVWVYKPTETDNPMEARFDGWCERVSAYKHYPCEQYFSELGEKHECKHWSNAFLSKMKLWVKESQRFHKPERKCQPK